MIRSGASLLSSPKDILEDLKLEPRKLQRIEVSDEENFLLDKISEGPTDMEEILYNSQLPLTKVLGLIRALENKDLVKRIAGNKVLRLPKPSRSRDS
jgi:predicted Rossmann fold nucleotide-binding protein DprA/Smf involved in DNA uptake